MIIVAFAKKTSKFIPKIFCRRYKHCAPILKKNNRFIMLQFVKYKHIVKIPLTINSIKLLKKAGWDFIQLNKHNVHTYNMPKTCVDLTKQVLGIKKAPFIQTPNALYAKIKRPSGRSKFIC